MTREHVIANTIRAYTPGIKELAHRCGCSANLLYRAANARESGCDIALGKIEQIMLVTEDYSILDWLNARFGFTRVQPPIGDLTKMQALELLLELQKCHIEALRAARAFFLLSTEENRFQANMALLGLLGIAATTRRQVQFINPYQFA